MICLRYVLEIITRLWHLTNISPSASVHVNVRSSFQFSPSRESCPHQSSPREGSKGRFVDGIPIYLSIPLLRLFSRLHYTPMSPCHLSDFFPHITEERRYLFMSILCYVVEVNGLIMGLAFMLFIYRLLILFHVMGFPLLCNIMLYVTP